MKDIGNQRAIRQFQFGCHTARHIEKRQAMQINPEIHLAERPDLFCPCSTAVAQALLYLAPEIGITFAATPYAGHRISVKPGVPARGSGQRVLVNRTFQAITAVVVAITQPATELADPAFHLGRRIAAQDPFGTRHAEDQDAGIPVHVFGIAKHPYKILPAQPKPYRGLVGMLQSERAYGVGSPRDLTEFQDDLAVKGFSGLVVALRLPPESEVGPEWARFITVCRGAGFIPLDPGASALVPDGRTGSFPRSAAPVPINTVPGCSRSNTHVPPPES